MTRYDRGLYPYVNNTTATIKYALKSKLPNQIYKYFDAVGKKLVCLFYIYEHIENYDRRYNRLAMMIYKQRRLGIKNYRNVIRLSRHRYKLEAYWEERELEYLLFQASSCYEAFIKALSHHLIRQQPPDNFISKFENLLNKTGDQQKIDQGKRVLKVIIDSERDFRGKILKPKQRNKTLHSLRDLAAHYEGVNVWFYILTDGARKKHGVYGGYVDAGDLLLGNRSAISVAESIRYHLEKMIEKCLGILFPRQNYPMTIE